MPTIKQKIGNTLKKMGKSSKRQVTQSYPFEYTHENVFGAGEEIHFRINNDVERFRLVDWGGEKEYVLDLVGQLKQDEVFYDIGSSVGLISITAAMVLAKGKVISFEPDPGNQSCLKTNYSLNNLSNFDIQKIAVGSEEGELELFTEGSSGNSPSLKPVNKISSSIKVPVKSIDDLLAQNTIPWPDIIKIDIEGAEMLALKGMKDLLSSDKRPRLIFLEIHPDFLEAFGTSLTEIFRFLLDRDYLIDDLVQRERQILCQFSRP